MSKILEVQDQEFEKLVLEAEKPVLVDFWAPWCGPCVMMAPFLEHLAEEFADAMTVVKVNIDENKTYATQFGVRSIPYLILFKNGEIVNETVGAPDPQAFVDQLEQSLASPSRHWTFERWRGERADRDRPG